MDYKYKNEYFDKAGIKNTATQNLIFEMEDDRRADRWKEQ